MAIIYLISMGFGVSLLSMGSGNFYLIGLGLGLFVFGMDKLIEDKIKDSQNK